MLRITTAILSFALIAAQTSWAADAKGTAREYYRYRDANGVMRISQGIPPEFSKLGYDVITADGTLIKKVAPELHGEALKADGKRRAEEEAVKQQMKYDQALLRRYSSPADIESALKRATNDFKIRIGIINSNLISLKQQIEREQIRAADLERSGQPVPQALTDNIKALSAEIDETERTIKLRQLEMNQEEENYRKDIERLKYLLAKIHGTQP